VSSWSFDAQVAEHRRGRSEVEIVHPAGLCDVPSAM
jgi:hypothetical protein